jgi:hypothetical protein
MKPHPSHDPSALWRDPYAWGVLLAVFWALGCLTWCAAALLG